jgi:hypothetical protein
VIPAVAHLIGSGGTLWRAELGITNDFGEAVSVDLVYNDETRALSASAEIPRGGGLSWTDVLVDLFGLEPADEAAGVVEISSVTPVVAGARSYAATPEGTFGQSLPALTSSDGIGPGQVGTIGQLARSPDRYTNLGVVNVGQAAVRVAISLRSGSGEPLGESIVLDLDPGRWRQLFDVLTGFGQQAAASARVEVLSPGGRVWAYASVIDALTRDPTTVPLQVP